MREQALPQVCEVSVRVSGRRHALVHLHDMHIGPGQLLIGQRTQHRPRGVPPADGHDEASPRGSWVATISVVWLTVSSPGAMTFAPMAIVMSGLIRNRQ